MFVLLVEFSIFVVVIRRWKTIAFKLKILRKICGKVKKGNLWRIRYNFEQYNLFGEKSITQGLKIGIYLKIIWYHLSLTINRYVGMHLMAKNLMAINFYKYGSTPTLLSIFLNSWILRAKNNRPFVSVLKYITDGTTITVFQTFLIKKNT